jgi:phosphatidate cytidylyltransferase
MQNLASRMFINLLGVPAILLMVRMGGLPFFLFFTVIAIIAQVELYLLFSQRGFKPQLVLAIILGIIWMIAATYFNDHLLPVLVGITALLLLSGLFRSVRGASADLALSLLGIIYLPVMISTLFLIRKMETGPQVLYMLFATIWICDALAYVFGKLIGGPKIAPEISPHKTVAGCIGGVVGAILTVVLFWWLKWQPAFMSLPEVIGFGLLCGVLGQAGDFVESIFKRDVGVKDSSTLLLGHGGMLDRFDSFFIGAPVIYFYMTVLLS